MISNERQQQIQSLIDAIPDGETYHDFPEWSQPRFRDLNVLPVMFDSGGACVLTPDAQWQSVLWDNPSNIVTTNQWDARIERTLALRLLNDILH